MWRTFTNFTFTFFVDDLDVHTYIRKDKLSCVRASHTHTHIKINFFFCLQIKAILSLIHIYWCSIHDFPSMIHTCYLFICFHFNNDKNLTKKCLLKATNSMQVGWSSNQKKWAWQCHLNFIIRHHMKAIKVIFSYILKLHFLMWCGHSFILLLLHTVSLGCHL